MDTHLSQKVKTTDGTFNGTGERAQIALGQMLLRHAYARSAHKYWYQHTHARCMRRCTGIIVISKEKERQNPWLGKKNP